METVKGFSDFLGKDARKRQKVLDVIRKEFESYGFEIADTPIVEYEEFVRGENQNDEAVRDIFKLEDRGKRKLALRYEFTFQLKRISKNQKLPYKRFQIGYVFRDEPIKQGRTRQFIQCDADIIGSNIKDEAECISVAKKCLDSLKIPTTIYINNRKLLDEILEKEGIEEKNRQQVIREIDKLDKLSKAEVKENLKKFKAEKVLKIFEKEKDFFKKYDSYMEIEELEKYLKLFKVKAEFRPFLARGFSYYNGSVFEIWSDKLGVALSGGGSYLIENNQSTGISLGIEPIILLAKVEEENDLILVASLNQDKETIKIVEKLRERGEKVNFISGKSPSKILDYANSKEISRVIIIGENEIKSGRIKIKDMISGKEEELKI